MSTNVKFWRNFLGTLKNHWGINKLFGPTCRFQLKTPTITLKNCNNFYKNIAYRHGNFRIQPCVLQTVAIAIAASDSRPDFDVNDLEDNITHLMILARLALEKGDMERAEAILQMGIKICEEHKISFGLPQIYDILATIALAEGEIEKAETIMVTVIEKLIQNGMEEDDHYIVDFKLRLSRIYSGYKENELAEIGFKTCLEAQKEKILKGDVTTRTSMLYINVLFWYGVHLIRNENYAAAKTMLDKAYNYSLKIKGLSPYQEMVILYTLSDLNLELGETDVALTKMQNAVMLGKGISSIDLPRCYVKLARIYLTMGVYDQARASAEEAAKLARIFSKIDIVQEAKHVLEEITLLERR